MKTCLIIVDSLRYDHTPKIEGFYLYKCISLANNTESSITTILTGVTPDEHGIRRTGDPKNEEKLKNVLKPIPNSFIASPAVIFHPYFTYSTSAKYSEEVFLEARNYLECDFMLLHLMDVHDYRDINRGLKYYKGYESMSEEALKWVAPSGLPRTQEILIQTTKDAGLLKAKYKGAVERVFEQIAEFVRLLTGWRVIITGDHGEDLTYFHHDGLDVYEVPLMTSFKLTDKTYTHQDVWRLLWRG